MAFTVEGIYYQIQPARAKYSVYKDSVDKNNFKVHGAQDVSTRHLKQGDIIIRYNKLQRFKFQNHRWYAQYPELYNFLQENKIEKFDDIADTVLMIEEYRREQMQKGVSKRKRQCVIVAESSDDVATELQQVLQLDDGGYKK